MRYWCSMGFALALCLGIVAWDCGDPPTSTPPIATGELRITAMDTTAIDSIQVVIDDLPFGNHKNPCTIPGLVIGVHRLFVSNQSSSSATMVEVFRNQRSYATLTLLSQGPYLGQSAPNFAARTITNDSVSLHQLRDKVVLLVFFEHT